MDIYINREGEQHGPYPEALGRQFLEEGKLSPMDLAWHAGADGWKPLSEVLGVGRQPSATPPPTPPQSATPPPTPPQSATPPPTPPQSATPAGAAVTNPDKIRVTREGKPIGPYSRDQAKEYFFAGQLLPTDWGWHDGMDEWKPIYEVLGLPPPAQPMSAAPARAKTGGRKGNANGFSFFVREYGYLTIAILFYIIITSVIWVVGYNSPSPEPSFMKFGLALKEWKFVYIIFILPGFFILRGFSHLLRGQPQGWIMFSVIAVLVLVGFNAGIIKVDVENKDTIFGKWTDGDETVEFFYSWNLRVRDWKRLDAEGKPILSMDGDGEWRFMKSDEFILYGWGSRGEHVWCQVTITDDVLTITEKGMLKKWIYVRLKNQNSYHSRNKKEENSS